MKYILTILTAAIISALFPSQAHTEQSVVEQVVFIQEWHVNWDDVDDIGLLRLTVEDIEEQIR